jgi:hypothetical protein
MGWNIGKDGEDGVWTGGENVVRDNLIFHFDPGDYWCAPKGPASVASTVKELGLGDTATVNSSGNDVGDLWTEAGGAPCFQFNGTSEYINFPTIDVSKFITGGATTTGAITSCVWFRTSHMENPDDGGLVFIENYTYGVFISNGDIQQYATDGSGTSNEYTMLDVTAYNDDNWHFLVAMMNNTSSTIGDTPAGACSIYVDDMVAKAASSTFHSSFYFRTTDADLNIGLLNSNTWYYEGEIGPVMMYSDYCLDEDERMHNYNFYSHRYGRTS